MASWNIPALLNAIKNDIVGLGSLLRSLAIGDPSAGNTDLPAQSKRMQEGTDGWEWQMFNGNAWNRMAKWNLNAAQVDGFDASAGTTANTIPVRDKNGDLPGNVLGNAATATKAEKLSATNPVEMGGTGATTPQQARQNLGTPPTEHSSSGTEFGLGTSVKHGHTKLSDATDNSSDVNGGTAATPKAVKTVADSVAALKADVESEFAATASAQAASDAAQNAAIAAAQTSANNAQTSADNAQQSANAAQESANAALAKEAVLPGSVIAWAANSTPDGYLLCNGAAVSRTTYKALFDTIGTTYGTGDGSTTFNLPNLTDRFIQGSGTAGTVKAAGLPNASGTFRAIYGNNSGAFSNNGQQTTEDPGNGGTSNNHTVWTMNLSKSNGIFGASNTVQPPALTMRYYIKY